MLTVQTLLQKKLFGNYLPSARPLEYRKAEWQELNKGRERSVRLIVRAMLGVPSAHVSEQEHPLWCFQFPKGSQVIVHLHKGTVTEIAVKAEDPNEVDEAVDFLITEVSTRLKEV